MKVATSIVFGNQATPDLAQQAVAAAMQKIEVQVASSVLLLLTSEFSAKPQAAIKAAAKAANCTQIMGCTAPGIFTEDDWVLDAPAAAVMVFAGDIALQLAHEKPSQHPLLTLCAPNAINSTWLNDGNLRYGGVSGDAIGQGNFAVWQNAKGDLSGQIDAYFTGVTPVCGASHGLQLLTQPANILQATGLDITQLGKEDVAYTPYASLHKAWQAHSKSHAPLPLHMMMAAYANDADDLMRGNYSLTNIIAYDESQGSVTLANSLQQGQFISWGLRDKTVAEADMLLTTLKLHQALDASPEFGLLFSSMGRGPYFYDGLDRDLKVITKQLPGMPLLGFYGNGEIATSHGKSELLQSSAVLSLFKKA